MMSEEKNICGLGGWLILVGLGLVITPFRVIATTFPIYQEIFASGTWDTLTTEGTEFYSQFWAPIILGEVFINACLVIAGFIMLFLFFTKNKFFPKLYIGVAVFSLIFIIIDAFSISLVLPNEPIFDPETTKELARALAQVLIWVPYMLVSKRVKATFIN